MTSIKLMPYAKELLDYYQETGVRIGLVTSSYDSAVQAVLGQHNLLDYFEFFVTRDVVEKPKPNAEPYLLAVAQTGLPKESIVAIEDTITGATSAKNAGLYCIGVSAHTVQRGRLSTAVDQLFDNLGEVLVFNENNIHT